MTFHFHRRQLNNVYLSSQQHATEVRDRNLEILKRLWQRGQSKFINKHGGGGVKIRSEILPGCHRMSSVPSCRCSSFWAGEGPVCGQVGGRSC